ncbi:MAG: hypothetical protein CM15mP62_24240 [Rhodospirillaceae bacterium]|nr:MAG: hypothetical protein CM15mP62_24240 [Rhodospirillaceae bacterium]
MTCDLTTRSRRCSGAIPAGVGSNKARRRCYYSVGCSIRYCRELEKIIETIFKCKNRSFEKPSGMFSNYELLKDIQVIASGSMT